MRSAAIATSVELDGSVAMAVALGWHPRAGRRSTARPPARAAAALARAAGVAVAGRPPSPGSAGAGGWSILDHGRGRRRVRGDGVRIALWPDGRSTA